MRFGSISGLWVLAADHVQKQRSGISLDKGLKLPALLHSLSYARRGWYISGIKSPFPHSENRIREELFVTVANGIAIVTL